MRHDCIVLSNALAGLAALLLWCPYLLRAEEACLPVEGDQILAGRLAEADPAFTALDPGIPIGYAPLPGAKRVISQAQLLRLAARHGVTGTRAKAICFVRATEVLTADRILKALRETWPAKNTRIEVVEFMQEPVPVGRLRFQVSGLYVQPGADPDSVSMWRGVVEFGTRRTFPIWARVRVAEKRLQVVAVRDLAAGEVIAASDIVQQEVETAPLRETPVQELADAIGAVPRRSIRVQEPLLPSLLRFPMDIEAGDVVHVKVLSGAARLYFDAKAESPGRLGDEVSLRNLKSGRRFRAVVVGEGEVQLDTGGA